MIIAKELKNSAVRTLFDKVISKTSYLSRSFGMMFSKKLIPGECMLFRFPQEQKDILTNLFVFHKINYVLLDDYNIVIGKGSMFPFQPYSNPKKKYFMLIEYCEELDINIGDRLSFIYVGRCDYGDMYEF